MSENKERINFDEFIRRKVEEYVPPPSPHLWKRIEKEISGKYKNGRKSFPFIIFSLLIIGGGIATTTYYILDYLLPVSNFYKGGKQSNKGLSRENTPIQKEKTPKYEENKKITENIPVNNTTELKAPPISPQKENLPSPGEKEQSEKPSVQKELTNDSLKQLYTPEESLQQTTTPKSKDIANQPKIIISKYNICAGELISLSLDTIIDGRYKWSFGDKYYSYRKQTTHIYKNPGIYQVSLEIETKDGKRISIIETNQIKVNPRPNAVISVIHTGGENSGIILENKSGVTTFKWIINNIEYDSKESTIKIANNQASTKVALIVANEYDCKDTAYQEIYGEETKDATTYVFSPNGDGVNDTWYPTKDIPSEATSVVIKVFDLRGQEVFSTTEKNNEWNGTLSGTSAKAKPGEKYIWTIEYTTPNGKGGKSGIIIVE